VILTVSFDPDEVNVLTDGTECPHNLDIRVLRRVVPPSKISWG
jgi:hypothetical protein